MLHANCYFTERGNMKKIILFLIAILFGITGFYISDGYSHNNSAPNSECYACHTGAGIAAELKLAGLPKQYESGKTYNLTLTVNSRLESLGDVKGGFSAEASAGELMVLDDRNTQRSASFITHTQDGSTQRSWRFAWKAPSGNMDAEIRIMVVAANGDYSSANDTVTAELFTIRPKK